MANASTDVAALVADLVDEQECLAAVLGPLRADEWLFPTPARGWDVRDTVAHLADTDDIAVDTCRGGPRALNDLAGRCASPEDVTLLGVLAGRRLAGVDVLAWWARARAAEREALSELDPATRVPWGLGMRPASFVCARLMETWAHALDVHAALGREMPDTDRLRHVAWIGTRALPYAYSVAGIGPPAGALRVELELPSGARWTSGPADATDRITGPAGQYCRVFVQRLRAEDATELRAEGDAARTALRVARSFL